uniref:Elongation factor Tu-type domain-containing protein n=1 Tax=Glossina pallidipes TaxID=7398 RepID=A0A1A9Z984_GLOPL
MLPLVNQIIKFKFIDIGVVTSIEMNHKQIESARKGQAICIKIEPIPGESPKMYGRHFDATDELVSKSAVTDFQNCKKSPAKEER